MCVSNVQKPRIQKKERTVWKVIKTNKEQSVWTSLYNLSNTPDKYHYKSFPVVNIAIETTSFDNCKKYLTGFCCFLRKKDAIAFQIGFDAFHRDYSSPVYTLLKKAFIPAGATIKNAIENGFFLDGVPCIIADKLIIAEA